LGRGGGDLASISLRSRFGFTSMYFDFTSVSLRYDFEFTSISLWFQFDFTSVWLRLHFHFTSVSLWLHFDVTSIPLRCHFDVTSVSLRFHFDSTSSSLRFHLDFTSTSLQFHFDSTSLSLRLHFTFTSISLRFLFDLNLISLRFDFDFTSTCHFDFTSISLRFHLDVTSISLWFHFDFISISLRFSFDFTSLSVRFHFDVTSIFIPFQVGFTSSSLRFHFEAEMETSPLKGKGNLPEAIREKGNRLGAIREKGKGRDRHFRRVSTTPTSRPYARTNETKRSPGWTHPPTSDIHNRYTNIENKYTDQLSDVLSSWLSRMAEEHITVKWIHPAMNMCSVTYYPLYIVRYGDSIYIYIYIHTTTGFEPRKKTNGWCTPFSVVNANCSNTNKTHHHEGTARPCDTHRRRPFYVLLHIYTRKWYAPSMCLFFLDPIPVVVYIYGVLCYVTRFNYSSLLRKLR